MSSLAVSDTVTSALSAALTPSSASFVAPSSSSTPAPIDSATSTTSSIISSVISSVVSTSAISSIVPTSSLTSSSAAVVSSSTTSSVIVSSTTSTTITSTTSTLPTSSSTTTSSSLVSSSLSSASAHSTGPAPVLLTGVIASSSHSAVAAATAKSTSKGGIGGSGISLGAMVGIIIGGLAVIAVIGLLVTRSIRKRGRMNRTMRNSTLFEPWPAPVAMDDARDDAYEKGIYEQNGTTAYGAAAEDLAYGNQNQPQTGYAAYPETGYGEYPQQQQHVLYPASPYEDQNQGQAPHPNHAPYQDQQQIPVAPLPAEGLHDGMMVRVDVGFARTLEDELVVAIGQQLYLHTAYDDGWSLCEDQNGNRGVVPINCIAPWEESPNPESYADRAVSPSGRRLSSMYHNTGNAGTYPNLTSQ